MVMVNLPTAGVDYHVPFGGRKGSSYGAARAGSLRHGILHDGEDRLYQSGLTSGAHMDQSIGAREQPRYIKLNDRDNVAIVVNDFGLTAGARFACGSRCAPSCRRATRPRSSISKKAHRSSAMARSSVMPPPPFSPANGSTRPASACRTRPRSMRSRSPPPCRRPCPRSKVLASKAFATPTARWARTTSSASRTTVQCVAGVIEFAVKRIKRRAAAEVPERR